MISITSRQLDRIQFCRCAAAPTKPGSDNEKTVTRFYERGCQHKHLTTNRRRVQKLSWQPALFPLRRTVEPALRKFGPSSPRGVVFRTEKRCGGRWSPTTVLFESQWTTAVPGRARGDRVLRGPSAEAVGHRVVSDPHPRPYAFRAHRR